MQHMLAEQLLKLNLGFESCNVAQNCVRTSDCMHVCRQAVHVNVYMRMCVDIHTQKIYIYICIYRYICIYTYIRRCVHVYVLCM